MERLGAGENPLGGLGLLGLCRGARDLAQAREEQGLVDPTVEDRNPPLAAFHDHVAALQAGLSCKLGGGEVNGHWSGPPLPPACGREVCRLHRMLSTTLSARSLLKP